MKRVSEQWKEQTRWNQKGQELIEDIQRHPNKFIVDDSRYSPYQIHQDLVESLGSLKGKRVLDLGSGRGKFSVFLTKQGAKTMGVDLGPQHGFCAVRGKLRIKIWFMGNTRRLSIEG